MNSVEPLPSDKGSALGLSIAFHTLVVLWVIAVCALIMGCSMVKTIRPAPVVSEVASFDGGEQNSGTLGFYTNGSGVTSIAVTPHFRDRFNAMVPTHGAKFSPPLKLDDGLTPFTNGTYLISLQHFQNFTTMNRWRKQALRP